MFKGFDKAKDIQYVYTPVFSSLCGVKLDYNNKAGYLLSGICLGHDFDLGRTKTAEHQKQTKCSSVYLYFRQEQIAVKKCVFLMGFMFQVGNLTEMLIIANEWLTLRIMSQVKSQLNESVTAARVIEIH